MKVLCKPKPAEKRLLNKEMLSHEPKGEKSKTVSPSSKFTFHCLDVVANHEISAHPDVNPATSRTTSFFLQPHLPPHLGKLILPHCKFGSSPAPREYDTMLR
jgi:hypothetical protein